MQLAAAERYAAEANTQGAGNAHATAGDVTDRVSVDAAFVSFCEPRNGLDVLVHAAGIEKAATAEEITEEDRDRIFDVNVKGTLFTNQARSAGCVATAAPSLTSRPPPGVLGYRKHGHYAASKGALLSWTRTIAMEWGRHGITANAICPGMWTPMYEATRAQMASEELAAHDAWLAQVTPIDGKLGDPRRDLAPFMVFLAGRGTRFISGQTLVCDGGRTMVR